MGYGLSGCPLLYYPLPAYRLLIYLPKVLTDATFVLEVVATVITMGDADAPFRVDRLCVSSTCIVPAPLHWLQTPRTLVPVRPSPAHFGQFILTVAIWFTIQRMNLL